MQGRLDVAEAAGDVGAVEHAVIVDQLDADAALVVDRAEGQGRRQRRDRVELLGAERAVGRKAERPEPLRPLPAGDAQRHPPEEPADERRRRADPEFLAEEADFLQVGMLVEVQRLLQLGQRLMLRSPEEADEDPLLAAVLPLQSQGTDALRVLVQPRRREREQRPSQRRILGGDQAIRLHEEQDPARSGRVGGAGLEQGADVDRPADRHRRHPAREVDQVEDEPPRAAERQRTPLRLVHPGNLVETWRNPASPDRAARPVRFAYGRGFWRHRPGSGGHLNPNRRAGKAGRTVRTAGVPETADGRHNGTLGQRCDASPDSPMPEPPQIHVHLLPSLIPDGGLAGRRGGRRGRAPGDDRDGPRPRLGLRGRHPLPGDRRGPPDRGRILPAGTALLGGERAGLADRGVRPRQLPRRLHGRGLPGQDAGDDHHQRHAQRSWPAGKPNAS